MSFWRVIKYRNWCWILHIFVMILLMFSCNCSKLRKQNSYLSKIQTLANYHLFNQFWGEEENHNKYSTPISIFDDPPKWHDTHIKVRSFSSYRCINQSSFKRLTNKKAKVWIHAPEKRGNLTSKVFLTKYTLFAYFKIQKKYSKLIKKNQAFLLLLRIWDKNQ